MNPLYAITAAALAGLAAMTALPAPAAVDSYEATCQTVDGVGFVCIDADTDCTDGSCGASVDGGVGVAAANARTECVDANGVANVCADAGTGGAQVDITYNVPDVASGEAHAGVGVGLTA